MSARTLASFCVEFVRPRERAAIELRAGLGCEQHTFVEIGRCLGVSRQRARQIFMSAIRRMQHAERLYAEQQAAANLVSQHGRRL